MTALLSVKDAVADLGGKRVLNGLSLRIGAGEMVALCGPNGAGKSSVIRASLGLLPLSQGEAHLGGDLVRGLSEADKGRRAAYLPQERHIAWNLPAIEVACLGLPFLSSAKAQTRALKVLDEVGIGHLAQRGVAEMSGGERARVLLARALVAEAPMLLADEPIAGLDPDAELLVLERLRARARGGASVLVSLHDLSLAAQFADRVIVVDQGRVVSEGEPTVALAPDVLAKVFKLDGQWIDTPGGPLLAARRMS